MNGISFHRFPRDKQRRRQWEIAVGREDDWTATSFSAVCSEHFNVNDFYLTDSGLRRLSQAAVPSINISPCQPPEPTISQTDTIIDIKESDTEEVIKLRYKVKRLEFIAESRKKKLLMSWRLIRKYKKKLQNMTKMLGHLIKIRNSEYLASSQYNYVNGVR
ncbi:THAP domain-containing protein [Phthorimaea operculella]|nr:THAP domain-containing protein [Phthorimaea operculella]